LGYYDQPSAIAALQGARKDRDLAVRLAAVRALVQRDRIESIRTLLADLDFSPDDPPLILTEIFAHISARLRPEAIRLLTEPLPDEWKRMLAIALGRNHVPEAFDGILALSRLPSPRLRAAAWVALRELADPRAGETVGEGLRDGSASVRRAACALHDFGPEGRALLVQHANTAPEDDVGLQVLRERQMEDQYGI
jgi:HEAT repeat protein